ncbi:MAG: chromate transporter [Lachnospiraceae bacterium]|nr:chromate transporter [Lachnospiraceae bacterium]
MVYLDLLIGFLKVGLFSFGGAYGAIPLIRDVVMSYGWMSDATLSNMIAVSESTPGPIMVNMATYVGSSQGGILGALLATFAVVLPAFLIILLIMVLLKNVLKNQYVQAVLGGLKPCVIGIVLAMGIYMIIRNIFPASFGGFDWKTLLLTIFLAAVFYLPVKIAPKVFKKKISPILLIVIAAICGIIIY